MLIFLSRKHKLLVLTHVKEHKKKTEIQNVLQNTESAHALSLSFLRSHTHIHTHTHTNTYTWTFRNPRMKQFHYGFLIWGKFNSNIFHQIFFTSTWKYLKKLENTLEILINFIFTSTIWYKNGCLTVDKNFETLTF